MHPRGVRPSAPTDAGDRGRRFNSRTHEGCDKAWIPTEAARKVFQFTHPRGVRQDPNGLVLKATTFQFTHPRGVRLEIYFGTITRGCFNSRTRGGCDRKTTLTPTCRKRFQFTHPRGVRRTRTRDLLRDRQFQFTHPRGVRRGDTDKYTDFVEFQFTHPRGVRHPRERGDGHRRRFQFTHPRGVRRSPR